jgi:uncharacterized protein (DUF1330 family)
MKKEPKHEKFFITVLLFINDGEEKAFEEYESNVLGLLKKYNGELIYRIHPDEESYASGNEECPHEIHLISFNSRNDFENYMNCKERDEFYLLREKSIKKVTLIEGLLA